MFVKHYTPNHILATTENTWSLKPMISNRNKMPKSNIYRNLKKVNQVIYTLATICVTNCVILAQTVLQIFCWQGSIGLQSVSRKRGTNLFLFLFFFYLEFYEKLIRLLKWFLWYFVDKIALLYKMPKSVKGNNSVKYLQNFAKTVNRVI